MKESNWQSFTSSCKPSSDGEYWVKIYGLSEPVLRTWVVNQGWLAENEVLEWCER